VFKNLDDAVAEGNRRFDLANRRYDRLIGRLRDFFIKVTLYEDKEDYRIDRLEWRQMGAAALLTPP
jgi:hypothetical protein